MRDNSKSVATASAMNTARMAAVLKPVRSAQYA